MEHVCVVFEEEVTYKGYSSLVEEVNTLQKFQKGNYGDSDKLEWPKN